MRPISPHLDGYDEVMVAEDQAEFSPLAAAILPHADGTATRVCRWTFSLAEREAILLGEDIYFGTAASVPLMPHWLTVGRPPAGTTTEPTTLPSDRAEWLARVLGAFVVTVTAKLDGPDFDWPNATRAQIVAHVIEVSRLLGKRLSGDAGTEDRGA